MLSPFRKVFFRNFLPNTIISCLPPRLCLPRWSAATITTFSKRPQEQLKILGEQNSIQTLPIVKDQTPNDIARRALGAASLSGSDIIIFDTAGRTQIDLSMMSEIKELNSTLNPSEVILVADSLTGQVAVNIATEFKKAVEITGIILTRVDGDGRGGSVNHLKGFVRRQV